MSVRPLSRLLPLVPLVALLLSLALSLGSVMAAAPAVTANPALIPFSETPGQPGTTTLTFAANGTTGLTACGQDNAVTPAFKLGAVDPATPLVVPFPFIQAGKYTFWVSADATCGVGNMLATATATRVGPTGKAGSDDIQIRFTGTFDSTNPATNAEVTLSATAQTFPIPDARVCLMSGDGAQVDIEVQVGQDPRPQGLGAAAATTRVLPIANQNGCKPIPWVVNGGYIASIVRSGVSFSLGFCSSANTPSVPPTATIGKCAQTAFSPAPGPGIITGTVINGSIVTGADNHAVQVCVAAFAPASPIAPPGTPPSIALQDTVNAYNQSGAVNLTPLSLNFASNNGTPVVKIWTYDITGAGPGGQGGLQFTCPPATAAATGPGGSIVVTVPAVPGATIIDTKTYFVQHV